MNDQPFRNAAKRIIIPFSCGLIFFVLIMATTFTVDGLLGPDYALSNAALKATGAEAIGYVFLAALLGEAMFGWKTRTGGTFDWIAALAHTLKENLYFLLGIVFGLCLLGLFLLVVLHPDASRAQAQAAATIQVSLVTLLTPPIAIGYEVLQDHIRREFSSLKSTLIFLLLSLLPLWLLLSSA